MRGSTTPVTVLLVLAIAACGGGDGGGQAAATVAQPPAASPPPATDSPERLAAIAAVGSLLNVPRHYLTLASETVSSHYSYSWPYRATSQCPGSGAKQILVDGLPWYGLFPTGTHTLAAAFDSCSFAGPFQDLLLNGGVDMVYQMSAPESVSATLTMKQFSADGLLPGLLADGPASYTIEQSVKAGKRLVDLRPGATLTSVETTDRIEFLGGRYASVSDSSADPTIDTEEYVGVTLDFDGVRYLLDGRLTIRNSGSTSTCNGEVRITDNSGALVARKYCGANYIEHELVKAIPMFYERN